MHLSKLFKLKQKMLMHRKAYTCPVQCQVKYSYCVSVALFVNCVSAGKQRHLLLFLRSASFVLFCLTALNNITFQLFKRAIRYPISVRGCHRLTTRTYPFFGNNLQALQLKQTVDMFGSKDPKRLEPLTFDVTPDPLIIELCGSFS